MSLEGRAPRRIPSLDGLRALSIGIVVFSHLVGTDGFPVRAEPFEVGYFGVRVFFVISGFLITSLLLAERERTGTVSLTGFYVRRAFRIFPAFYAFIIAMVIADLLGGIELRDLDVLHGVTFTTNYHYERSWELGHLWSLSIEEQFYLLWPAMVLWVGRRHVGAVAVGMIVMAPVMRVIAWLYLPHRDDVIMEAYPCVMDAIAVGSLFAVLRTRLDTHALYQRFLRSPWFIVVPLITLATNIPTRVAIDYTVAISVQNIGLALIVDRCTRITTGPVFELLNTRALVWIGTLSYSLYLWQEPFLNHRAHQGFTTWPLNLGLAVLCAIGSFYLIEKPFFELRDARSKARAARAAAATPRS
jgi:peptidoglycan/LPS O-acetylase OafA/YrhL